MIGEEFARLRADATEWLEKDQGHVGPSSLAYSAEMRYRGQSFELETKLDVKSIERGDLDALAAAFHAEHKRVYGHSDPKAPIQVIALHLVISGHGLKPELPRAKASCRAAGARAGDGAP